MHKLMEYVCDELMELEKKVGKEGQLSMQEVQLLDTLAHTKKNLMKCEEMEGQSYAGGSYGGSYRGSYGQMYDGGSYARGRGRGAARDSMGRYSSEGGYSRADEIEASHDRMMQRLQQIMHDTPDERERRKLDELLSEFRGM